MEEEPVISQGSKRPFPADELVAAEPPLGNASDEPATFDDDSAILGLPAPSSYGSVLGDDEDEDGEVYADMSDDDSSSDSDSDSEFEDHGNRVRFWDGDAAAGSETDDDLVAGPLMFLGRLTRFASFHGAAGFMRLSAAQIAGPGGGGGGGGEDREGGAIVVHYRLTRFSRPWRQSGGGGDAHGVEVRDFGTALHHVRYLVPSPVAAGGDPARSLRLVGAALAADVYPYRHYEELQAVWSGLVAALPVRVPPRATRLVVTVDVGVLRGEDRTPERMERVRAALAALARDNDAAAPMACGLEQLLPAPVCCGCDDDSSSYGGEDARPAKRRRRFAAVEGEVCAICHETLQHGLAAWPRCSHVFHGKCLEQLLVTVQHRCPMCRSTLSSKGMFA